MNLDRRGFLALTAIPAARAVEAKGARTLRPEDFGARGDGVTNDTMAFARLSAEVNRIGGGIIELRPGRTYIVGSQFRTVSGWDARPILNLSRLRSALIILGHGARLVAQPGLRFGTFDLKSGKPIQHRMPYIGGADLAVAYRGMIAVSNCAAPVEIRDIELDGNINKLEIGGQYGDTGWQIPASGLLLLGNLATEIVDNVHSHHHGQDGAVFIGSTARVGRGTVKRLTGHSNGRQGLSITGGRCYDFVDCNFSYNGRGKVKSAPAAGVDIEAENPPIRDISFTRCKFMDNGGCGMVADSGDSEDLRFIQCRFIGTTSWSAWPRKPRSVFEGCIFIGSVVHAFPDTNPDLAAKFVNCTFTDDPKLSPTRVAYTDGGAIVNLGQSDNVLFDRCRFKLIASGTLPWSWKATYRDCAMSQTSRQTAFPKGRYVGRNTIEAPVDLYGSMIEGVLILNGRQLPTGPVGVSPW